MIGVGDPGHQMACHQFKFDSIQTSIAFLPYLLLFDVFRALQFSNALRLVLLCLAKFTASLVHASYVPMPFRALYCL
jgi:hypothetical protein